MKRNFIGASDPGLIRSNNQDAFYTDPEGRFFIVADGMGGHAGGEEASRIATQEIQAYLGTNWNSVIPSQKLLEEALLQANEAIIRDQQSHPERSDMGTTAVVVLFREDSPLCAHVGDSRLYRWRNSQLDQITEDHTWVARALKVGDILPDEARIHPFRHVLSRCLGREDLQHIEVQPLDIQEGDRLLLCSDGLTEELVDEKIANYMQDASMLDKTSIGLIEAAKEHGGHDNITVVLVAIDN
jgi:PPM family protein phosphatase